MNLGRFVVLPYAAHSGLQQPLAGGMAIYLIVDAASQRVFTEGALPVKTEPLIAVAVAHVTQCPYCIRGHTELAVNHGATEQEVKEAEAWIKMSAKS